MGGLSLSEEWMGVRWGEGLGSGKKGELVLISKNKKYCLKIKIIKINKSRYTKESRKEGVVSDQPTLTLSSTA